MRRTTLLSIFAMLLPLLSAGCFDRVRLPDELEDRVVTIRFWHSMAGELGDALKVLIERFEQRHPNIRVVSVYQGSYGSLSQKLIGAVIAHEPPDVSQAYPAWISFLNQDSENGSVLALDDYIAADPDFDRNDIIQVLLQDCMLNGKLYALPFNKSFPVLYYNREMFRQAGLKAPTTWDEFAEAGRKLTVDRDGDGIPDQWGWAFNNDSWIFECTVLQFGGRLVEKDGLTGGFADPAAIKALGVFVDAAFGTKPYAYAVTGYDHQSDFVARKVAMIQTSSVSRKFMKDQLRFDYGMLPLPAGKRRAAILSGTNICMFKTMDGDKPAVARRKASWAFIKFFCSAEATAYWSMRTSYVPVRKSALALMKDYLKRDPNARAAIDQLDYTYFEPTVPAWYECRQILRNCFQKVTTEFPDLGVKTEERKQKVLSEYLGRANAEICRKLRISRELRNRKRN